MRILASGAVTGTPIDTVTEAEQRFLDRVAAVDGAPEISGGLLAIAAGEERGHEAQTASSVWRVHGEDGALIGFGIRALQGERHAAEFLIAPDHRGHGLGETLLTAILTETPAAWCWSHGDDPAAKHLAQKHGLSRDRVLYQMRTDSGLTPEDLPVLTVPEGVTLRSFAPGDEEGWLRVNNAAFDWHPEQGHQTLTDIAGIVEAEGFDPDSVILADRDGEIIGFHQTKLSDPDPAGAEPADPDTPDHLGEGIEPETAATGTHAAGQGRLGEVYVVAVDPAVHAKGVGRALTVAGMHRMLAAGAEAIELYVESDNATALGLYERLGFHVAVAHVAYAPASPTDSTQEHTDV